MSNIAIVNFNSGEVSPQTDARKDIEKYTGGCRKLENMIPDIYGNATKRPGTEYLSTSLGGGTHTGPDGPTAGLYDYPLLRAIDDTDTTALTGVTEVSSLEDLQNMKDDLTANYVLTGNIDASDTSTWNGGLGFLPIGDPLGVGVFEGSFDGQGFTISNLTINRPGTLWVGLFGYLSPDEGVHRIQNVTLADVNVIGHWPTGSLIGLIAIGDVGEYVVTNCHSSGTVKSEKAEASGFAGETGGLIGELTGAPISVYDCSSSCTVLAVDGETGFDFGGLIGLLAPVYGTITISNCFATGTVSTGVDSEEVGGLIGYAQGRTGLDGYNVISNCYSTGDVSGHTSVGGFVGLATEGTTVTRCYSRGDVVSVSDDFDGGGGFIGFNLGGNINRCYSWGDVSGVTKNYAGGFCWSNTGTITICYSIGAPTGYGIGGLVQNTSGAGSVTSCYWDTETSGTEASDGGTGYETILMKTESTYIDWDFDIIWIMPEA